MGGGISPPHIAKSRRRGVRTAYACDFLDLAHLGDEVAEQVLDAVLQRRGRRRAAGAGAAHVEEHDAVAKALEGDVAAVLGDGRAHARLDQFLDGGDGLGIVLVEELLAGGVRLGAVASPACRT